MTDLTQHQRLLAWAQGLTAAERKRIHHQLQRLHRQAVTYPLSVARLWRPHCCRWDGHGRASPLPAGRCGQEMASTSTPGVYVCQTAGCVYQGTPEKRTSQRDILGSAGDLAVLLGGGNRAGKTELGAQYAVAVAGGRQASWVQAWLETNGLPPSIVPAHPGRVWASSVTFSDALEYLRPKLDRYLPAGSSWSGRNKPDQATVTLPGGGVIVSKADSQGREKFQGAAVDLVWLDEEHSEAVFEECMARTVDLSGRVILTMTPLKGLTWPHKTFLEEQRDGHTHHRISGLDNPHNSSIGMRRRWKHLPPAKADARLYGLWGALEGLVYPMWDTALHVVPSRRLPPEWERYGAIDFGTRNPFCYLHTAIDPIGRMHITAEHYQAERPLSHHAAAIKRLWRQRGEAEVVVADPANRDSRFTLAEHDIATVRAIKDVQAGISAVCDQLSLDADGRPGLVVHDCCTALIEEFRAYRWKKQAATAVIKEEPEKRKNHAMDALRYFILWYQRRAAAFG